MTTVASLVAQMVKNLLAMQDTQVRFLGQGRYPGEGNRREILFSRDYLAFRSVSSSSDLVLSPGSGIF